MKKIIYFLTIAYEYHKSGPDGGRGIHVVDVRANNKSAGNLTEELIPPMNGKDTKSKATNLSTWFEKIAKMIHEQRSKSEIQD